VLRPAPPRARFLAAEVGVVNLHTPFENTSFLTMDHDLPQRVFHLPGGLVANAKVTSQFQRRDIVLGLGQQVHAQEPARQRQLGRLKEGCCGDCALVPATRALPVSSILSDKPAMSQIATARAAKTRRPT